MARPTERALKRKPQAVVLLTTLRRDVPEVPNSGREFEWFVDDKARGDFFDQNVEFHKSDTKEHDDMAYLAVEITDTATMTVGRIDAQPVIDSTKEWKAAVKNDITRAFTPVVEKEPTKKAVRPRKKSAAAAKVAADPDAKKEGLRKRLDAKKSTAKKSETGDKPPAKATADA